MTALASVEVGGPIPNSPCEEPSRLWVDRGRALAGAAGWTPFGRLLLPRPDKARGYLKTLLPRFARHPATGSLEGDEIKRFPETVRRRREATRLFEPAAGG